MSSPLHRIHPFISRLIAVLFVAVAAPVLIAGPASAHHPEISGSADCAGAVAFTAVAWAGSTAGERTNSSVRVDRSYDNGQTWQFVMRDAFNTTNNYDFTGGFSMGAATTVKLRVTAESSWGNGTAGGQQTYADVYAPTGCGNAPIVSDCTSATVTLNNTGVTTQSFTITASPTINGTSTWTRSVAGKTSSNVLITGLVEDTSYTLTVTMGSTTVGTKTVRPDCAKPAASLTKSCTAWTVVLDNTANNVAATYTVTVDGTSTSYAVAKTTKTITIPVTEDSTHTVTVAVGGVTLVQESSTVDCVPAPVPPTTTPAPAPVPPVEVLGEQAGGRAKGSIYTSCQQTVRVTMKNTSSRTVVYKVVVGKKVTTMKVKAHTTRKWTTSGPNKAMAKLMVGKKVLASKRIPGGCAQPEVLPATGVRHS